MGKPFRNAVIGSYPRAESVADTLKRPTWEQADIDAYIAWAAQDQVDLGLEVITDGEGYRENMYYYYQKRVDGISFDDMVMQKFGDSGFQIECPRLTAELKNPRFNMAHNWKIARKTAPAHVKVKQTVTSPYMLARYTVNERPDLYPDTAALSHAWAVVLMEEIRETIAAGCDFFQFDEPMWTEAPQDSELSADLLNAMIDRIGKNVRIALHVCGGNPRRKRVFFGKYTDLVPAFSRMKVDEVSLEYCTLGYDLTELWKGWDYQGDLTLGVIDQRSDELESVETIRSRTAPLLEYFSPERLILSSECGFGHVPLDVTRAKLGRLVEACRALRSGLASS